MPLIVSSRIWGEVKMFLETAIYLADCDWIFVFCDRLEIKDETAGRTPVFHNLSITVSPVKPRTCVFKMQNEVKD